MIYDTAMSLLEIVVDDNFNVLSVLGNSERKHQPGTEFKFGTVFLNELTNETPPCSCRLNLKSEQTRHDSCSTCICSQLLSRYTHDLVNVTTINGKLIYTFLLKPDQRPEKTNRRCRFVNTKNGCRRNPCPFSHSEYDDEEGRNRDNLQQTTQTRQY
jgi:hypothetical protein